MEQKTVINLGKQFGRYPAGRYLKDGPYSGQAFRENYLLPALRKNSEKIVIEFDDARGLASSFLEETFGGLVREGFPPQTLIDRLELRSQDRSLIEEIIEYIRAQGQVETH